MTTPIYVHIGTTDSVEHFRDEDDILASRPIEGERIFEIVFPENLPVSEMAATTRNTLNWQQNPKYVTPRAAWVRSNSSRLQETLHEDLGLSNNVVPDNWGKENSAASTTSMPSLITTMSALQASLMLPVAIASMWGLFKLSSLHLRTNGGRDYQAALQGNPASNGTGAYAPASYIGVSADLGVPTITDTTLVGEITSGTLTRAQGAFAHTTGAASYTISKLFTSDQTISLTKLALFNSVSGGVPYIVTPLALTANMNSGDQINLVETVTL